MIDFKRNWLGTKMAEMSDDELCSIYEEIHDFRNTGVLSGEATMRELDRAFRRQNNCDSNLRLIEDAVLYEIGRRFYNLHELRESRYRNLKPGDPIWYADIDNGIIEKGVLDSIYFNDGVVTSFFVEFEDDGDLFDGSGLGTHYFDNEEDAKDALMKGMTAN